MKTNLYDPKVEALAQLLGGYEDLERVSYSLTLEKLKTSGIEFAIENLSFQGSRCLIDQQFFKKNITFCELLQTKVDLVDSYTMNRKHTYRVSLFYEDVYRISFRCGNMKCDYVLENELGKLVQRINPANYEINKANFFSSLPEQFREEVFKNGKMIINVQLLSIGKNRTQCEKNSNIFETDIEVKNMLKKSSLRYNVKIPKRPKNIPVKSKKTVGPKPEYNRLGLWGLDTSISMDGNNIEDIFETLPEIYDFGIKDVIHLRYLVNGMRDDLLTNEELLNPSGEVLLHRQKHLEMHHFLLNNIPF